MTRWTREEYDAHVRRQTSRATATTGPDRVVPASGVAVHAKPSKYRNTKTMIDGFVFDSKHEADCWLRLTARVLAKEITDLQRQIPYGLIAWNRATQTPHVVANMVLDFSWRDAVTNRKHHADAKSAITKTQTYKLKKLWLEQQESLVVEEL